EYKKSLRKQIIAKGVLDYFVKDNISVINSVIYFIDRLRKNREIQTLVVDDSRSFRGMVLNFLKRHGFKAFEAESGQQALDILKNNDIHMMITDYNMPNMDGIQLTKKVRAKYPREHLAIIGLSSQGSRNMATEFVKAGANDFLDKPFQDEELFCRVSQNIEIIENHLKLESLVRERSKRLEEANKSLKVRENHLQAVLDTAIDAIVSTDMDGRIIDFNPAAETLFGYSKGQVMGRLLTEVIIPKQLQDKHKTALELWRGRADKQGDLKRRLEVQGQRSDGMVIDLEVALTVVESEGNFFITGFINDITERKQLFQSLQETLEVAESANKAKSEFLANMSHEIRTPMNAIIGMTDIVMDMDITDEQRENLAIVQTASQSLLALLNSILDLSKIEAGQLSLEKINFDILGRLENSCETVAVNAFKKDVDLLCWVSPDVPEAVVGDPLRLNQIILNLLNNAIKFTNQGEVLVRVAVAKTPADKKDGAATKNGQAASVLLHFSIVDSGIGIPEDRLKVIFDRFSQADGSTTRRYGGTGLGLNICKQLVSLMRGDIWVESEVDKGTTFHFTAPLGVGKRSVERGGDTLAEDRGDSAVTKFLQGITVWLAYESQTGFSILQEMLKYMGAKVEKVADGDSLKKLLTGEKMADDKVLVVDFNFLVSTNLVAEDVAGVKFEFASVVLLPSNKSHESLPTAGLFTNIAFLKKPARRFYLPQVINKLLKRTPIAEKSPTEKPRIKIASSKVSLHVLVVDNQINTQKLIISTLERAGHNVTVVDNDQDALSKLRHKFFDIIFIDLQLPQMKDFKLVADIGNADKILSHNRNISIIAMSEGKATESLRAECLSKGMDELLRKPFRESELLKIIATYTKVKNIPVKKLTSQAERPVLKSMADDKEEFTKNRQIFIDEASRQLQLLQQGATNQDLDQSLFAAKWFNDTAKNIGATRVKIMTMQLRGKVEMKKWDESQKIITNLEAEIKKALQALS
ncbi:MAG: response regulator, partial [Magnetococcales bacterium]|nr:response regulator [Magnetococcales bacterium]